MKTLKVFSVGDRDSGVFKTFKVFRGGQVAIPPPPLYILNLVHFVGELSCIPDSGGALKEGIKEE